MPKTCIFCMARIGKKSPNPELCALCYRLIKKVEKEEMLDYLCDG